MKIETTEQTKFDSVTIQVDSPDGAVFVTITEDNTGRPNSIWIQIGKAGGPLAAWSQALARMATIALDHGAGINDLIVELSGMHTDKVRMKENGEVVRSSVAAVANALMKYRKDKFEQTQLKLVGEKGKDERAPRLGR